MKKRLLSLTLCLALVFTMFGATTLQVSAADDGLAEVDQSFVGLSADPDGWTTANGAYVAAGINQTSANVSANRPLTVGKNTDFDTNGLDYTFTINFSCFSQTQYIHFGAASYEEAIAASVGNTGYTLKVVGGVTSAHTYTLYKNGNPLTTWSYAYGDTVKEYVFEVTSTGITVKKGRAEPITVADTAPITRGFIGVNLRNNTPHTWSRPTLASIKLVKSLAVASTEIPDPVDREGTTPISITFNASIKNEGITNKTNAYLAIPTAEGDVKFTDGYTVTLENDGKTIVFTPVADALNYKGNYKAIVTENLESSTNGVKLGATEAYPFTVEDPPFEVTVGLYEGTTEKVSMTTTDDAANVSSFAGNGIEYALKAKVINTARHYVDDCSAYLVISFENDEGEALDTFAKKVTVPEITSTDTYLYADNETVTIPSGATKMYTHLVTAKLDSYFPEPPIGGVISDADVSYQGDTVIISGNAGTSPGEEVYLMIMNLDGTSTAYTFDTSIATGAKFGEKIQKFAKTTTGANGYYEFEFPMHNAGSVATDWKFYIGGAKFSTAQEDTFYFASESMKNSIVTEINDADEAGISDILNTHSKLKTLGLDNNPFILGFKAADQQASNTALIDTLATKLYNAKQAADFSEIDGAGAFIGKLNELSVYIAIENDDENSNTLRNLIVNPTSGEFTDEAEAVLDFGTLDGADPLKPTTVTSVFENELTPAARDAVLDVIMGNPYGTPTEVHTVFKNNVMVKAFSSDDMDITELLRDNYKHFDINLDVYNKLSTTQMADANDALKTATTLDASSTARVGETVQEVINSVIAKIDLSVFKKTFTSADDVGSGNTTPDGWELIPSSGTKGTFEDSGYRVTNGSHQGAHYIISPASKEFYGDYVLTASMSNGGAFQNTVFIFDYEGESDYYAIFFNYNGNTVKLFRNGTTELSSVDGNGTSYNKAQIVVEKSGRVTVKNKETGDNILSPYYIGEDLTDGRAGAGLNNAYGGVSSVTVTSYLSLKDDVVELGQADMADTERLATFTGEFSFPVDAATVNTNTVRILDANKNVIEGAVTSASVSPDGVTLTVVTKELDYKTDYYLNLTTGIKIAARESGTFMSDVELLFNTKAPELNITKMYDTSEDGYLYFTNDISRYKERYERKAITADTYTSLKSAKGSGVSIYMKGLNTGAAKTADIYVTIEDENSTYAVTKVDNVLLSTTATESWITPAGFSGSAAALATITLPAASNVTDAAVVKYYIIEDDTANDANLATAYPKVDNSPVTPTGERPSFSLVADDLKVWGYTYSGAKDKDVNMVIEDDLGNPVLVANTKTTDGGRYDFDTVLDPKWFTSETYHIYIAGQDYGVKVTPVNELKRLNDSNKTSLMSTINGAILANNPSTIATAITSNADKLGLTTSTTTGVNLYSTLLSANASNITDVAEKVAERTDGTFDGENGYKEFINFVREAMVVQAYEKGLTATVYGSDGEFLLEEIIAISAVDGTTNSTTPSATTVDAFEKYTDLLTDTGKEQVRNNLLNKSYGYEDTEAYKGSGKEKLLKAFIQQVVLASLDAENVEVEGPGGHITEIITNNGLAAGMTSTAYNKYVVDLGDNVDVLNASLLQNSIASIDTLNYTINNYNPNGGGNDGGGGSTPTPPPTGGIPDSTGPSVSVGIAGGATIGEAETNMNFTDLSGYEWAAEAISALAKQGVVSGDGNGTFRPGDRVKREELMKMALNGMDISINNYVSSSFTDADESHWAYKFIATAEEKGFTTGRGDGTFGFGEDITREEVATILYRILVALGKAGAADNSVLNGFNDKADVSVYAVDAISFMVDNGIINGVEANVLAPKNYCTRAQVAKMVYGVMDYLK